MRHRDRITLAVGAAALLTSVLAVGGTLRWTQSVVAALTAIALALQLFARRRLSRVSPLVAALGAAMALSLLQLIPLPSPVRSWLSPVGEGLRADGAALAGTSPWPVLSLDPPATLRALTSYVTLLGIAVLALRFAASERTRFWLLSGVAATCGIAALVTGIHTLVGADALFGLYHPVHASPPVFGPLLNTNHLGSLMAFGAVLSAGLAFYARQRAQLRALWITNAVACILVVLATASRGAALALAFGMIVTIALLVASRFGSRASRGKEATLVHDIPIVIVVVLALGLAVLTSAGKVADQLEGTSLTELESPVSKFAAWRASLELVEEAPLVGIGRGALEPVFTRVHPASAHVTFSHLENEYVQAVVEWGVPGALLLALALVWCAAAAARRWRDGALAASAIGALTGLLFQSSVDFGIELHGLAVPATIVAATVTLVPLREEPSRRGLWSRGGLIASLLVAAVTLLLPVTRGVAEDRDAVIAAEHVSIEHLATVVERHPLDYFGFAQTAITLAAQRDPRAVRYLNHSLALHPTHPGLHRLAARMLVAGGYRNQAAIELALAMRGTPLPHKLLAEIITLLPQAENAAAAIPIDYPKPERVVRSLRELKRVDVALVWLAAVVKHPQRTPELLDKLYELALEHRRLDIALHAARLRLGVARTSTSRLMLAKVQFELREFDDVLMQLGDVSTWQGRLDEQAEAWTLVCDVHLERRDWENALKCLHRLDAAGIIPTANRPALIRRLSSIDEQRRAEAHERSLEVLRNPENPL